VCPLSYRAIAKGISTLMAKYPKSENQDSVTGYKIYFDTCDISLYKWPSMWYNTKNHLWNKNMVREAEWFEKHGQTRCHAHRKNGNQCKNYAAPGFKVCWKHGVGGPNSHHRKYRFKSETLNQALETLANDPDRLDLTEELALNRLCLQEVIRKMDDLPAKKAGTLLMLTEDITNIASKMAKIEKDLRMSVNTEQLQLIADQFTTIIARHITDEDVLAKIQDELGEIAIPEAATCD